MRRIRKLQRMEKLKPSDTMNEKPGLEGFSGRSVSCRNEYASGILRWNIICNAQSHATVDDGYGSPRISVGGKSE